MPLVPGVTIAEHLRNNAMVLVALFLVDRLLISPFVRTRVLKARQTDSARWFFLHASANLFVCLTAVGSMYAVLADPLKAMDVDSHLDVSAFGSGSIWPLTIINSVHVYHMIGGFGLSSADYFHHILFSKLLRART